MYDNGQLLSNSHTKHKQKNKQFLSTSLKMKIPWKIFLSKENKKKTLISREFETCINGCEEPSWRTK